MEGTEHVAPDDKPRRVISVLPPGASVVLGEHESAIAAGNRPLRLSQSGIVSPPDTA